MPQFDIFIWFSLSFWTIFTFQILYYVLLYFIIAPFANVQKTLIKLHLLQQKANTKAASTYSILECAFKKIYKI